MRAVLLAMPLFAAWAVAAEADCLYEVGQFREKVERLDAAAPTAQTAAAAKELRQFDRDEVRDEVDCYNVLARARQALTASEPKLGSPQEAKAR